MSDSEDDFVFKKKKVNNKNVRKTGFFETPSSNKLESEDIDDYRSIKKQKNSKTSTENDKSSSLEVFSIKASDQLSSEIQKRDVAVEKDKAIFDPKEMNQPKWMRINPMKQNEHARGVSMFDYAADICKDYKETGRCNWGDACKFMHDRSTQKNSAAQEREYQAKQKSLKEALEKSELELKQSSKIITTPTICIICDGPFKNPIVTSCIHFFCQGCALKYFVEHKKCAQCHKVLDGSFKNGKTMLEDMKKQEEKQIEEMDSKNLSKALDNDHTKNRSLNPTPWG